MSVKKQTKIDQKERYIGGFGIVIVKCRRNFALPVST